MKKVELKKMRTLRATKKMMKMAAEDTVKRERVTTWSGHYIKECYTYGLYMRCQILNGILKVAFFLPENMRMGAKLPAYELFINRPTGEFLTYDRKLDRWLTAKVDMIPWPKSFFYSDKMWINTEGFRSIQKYLGVSHGGFKGILEYQRQVRAAELKQRHKRETDPWDMDMAQTPELPKDWDRWISKVGIQKNYIFYRYDRKGATKGYCTYCEKEVPIRYPKHNKTGTCSRCRHKITFKSEGKAAGVISTGRVYMHLLQRCEDGMMVREFMGARIYRKSDNYRIAECRSAEIRRVIFDSEGHGLRAYDWGDYKHSEFRWIKTSLCSAEVHTYYSYYYHTYEGRVYGRTLPDLAKKELRKTGLAELVAKEKKIDPEHYLTVLKSVPELERLAKAGLTTLVRECMERSYAMEDCFTNRSHSDLKKLLGIDSQELARLRKCNGGIRFLKWLQYEKTTGKLLPDQVISWFCRENISSKDLKFISSRMNMVQIYNYVRRQMSENGMKSREVLTTWSDYLAMAERFHMDTQDPIVYRVRRLRKRHDELVKMSHGKALTLRAGEILRKYPHVEQIYKSIRDIYEYSDKDYTVVCPRSIEDVLREGENLHHCVGNSDRYWERIERKESYIMFLRHSKEPERAYYTLEIEPDGTVRQQRTMYDRQEADIEDAKKFLRKWQAEVSLRISSEEEQLAQISHSLREQEFAEMREKQLVIQTGELSGRLLVDVLTEDLMEAA